MRYPGRIVKAGEKDAGIVKALKQRLNEVLAVESDPTLKLDPADPNFGPRMRQTVKFFQTRNVDAEGRPLKQDGEVGALTWAALFGADAVPRSDRAPDPYLGEVLKVAEGEEAKCVREVPVNSNRGPEVNAYLASTDTPPGNSWCCAFVYWCFDQAARKKGVPNRMVKTAGCLDHWKRAAAKGAKLVRAEEAKENAGLVQAGMVFIVDHGGGKGHTGLVEKVEAGLITTIEGNTDASKTREGGGVYRLVRKIVDINKGFIDYSA